MKKHPTSFFLSDEAHAIIQEMAERTGASKAGVIESAVRVYREVLGVAVQRTAVRLAEEASASKK